MRHIARILGIVALALTTIGVTSAVAQSYSVDLSFRGACKGKFQACSGTALCLRQTAPIQEGAKCDVRTTVRRSNTRIKVKNTRVTVSRRGEGQLTFTPIKSKATDKKGQATVTFRWSSAPGVYQIKTSGSSGDVWTIYPLTNKSRSWTYMIYLGADNNLSDAGLGDWNEMESVGSTSDVAVVVQAEFSAQYSQGIASSQTIRGLINNDFNGSSPTLTGATSIGNVDMAKPESLRDFIQWAAANYPAEHYALVIWDHGAGWKKLSVPVLRRGAVQDETSGSFMSLPQLAQGVRDSGVHFSMIDFDACLMAMYEVAYEFLGLADYMVFSEETEPGEGNPYDLILTRLVSNPAMSGQELALGTVDTYNEFYTTNDRGSTTKSAVDMSAFLTLDANVRALVPALLADSSALAVLSAARANTQEYTYADNHDLGALMSYLVANSSSDTIKSLAANVLAAISSTVFDNKMTGSGVANSTGLAIWLPKTDETDAQGIADYSVLASNLSGSSPWKQVVDAVVGIPTGSTSAGQGTFALYTYWEANGGGACDADIDLLVGEPTAGGGTEYFAPYLGSTSPNGFFSADSALSGKSEEYYLANDQVHSGDYTFLINYYSDGRSCAGARVHVLIIDPPNGVNDWYEISPPEGIYMDRSNTYPGGCDTLSCFNQYSDWWYMGSLTRLFSGSSSLHETPGTQGLESKRNQMVLFAKRRRLPGALP